MVKKQKQETGGFGTVVSLRASRTRIFLEPSYGFQVYSWWKWACFTILVPSYLSSEWANLSYGRCYTHPSSIPTSHPTKHCSPWYHQNTFQSLGILLPSQALVSRISAILFSAARPQGRKNWACKNYTRKVHWDGRMVAHDHPSKTDVI